MRTCYIYIRLDRYVIIIARNSFFISIQVNFDAYMFAKIKRKVEKVLLSNEFSFQLSRKRSLSHRRRFLAVNPDAKCLSSLREEERRKREETERKVGKN